MNGDIINFEKVEKIFWETTEEDRSFSYLKLENEIKVIDFLDLPNIFIDNDNNDHKLDGEHILMLHRNAIEFILYCEKEFILYDEMDSYIWEQLLNKIK